MFNHQPPDYECPLCKLVTGVESKNNRQQDIVFQNELVTASIAPKWWINNPGSVLVMPNKHIENLYDIPDDVLSEVYRIVKMLAIAIRSTYDCQGTSTRQHNEPAGNQDVWHLHVHVFPRYQDDLLYQNHNKKRFVDASESRPYAEKLRAYLRN